MNVGRKRIYLPVATLSLRHAPPNLIRLRYSDNSIINHLSINARPLVAMYTDINTDIEKRENDEKHIGHTQPTERVVHSLRIETCDVNFTLTLKALRRNTTAIYNGKRT